MSSRLLSLAAFVVAATIFAGEAHAQQASGKELEWFGDTDAAQREAVQSGRLVLAVLSSASVTANPAEDPALIRVEQLISRSQSLRALVSSSCVLLAQRCGPPGVLFGERPPSGGRLQLGILDDQLACYRLALGLPDDRWLTDALNDAVLQRLILAGIETPEARTEMIVARALARLEPAWQAQVGGRGGELAEHAETDEGADAADAGWRLRAKLHWQNLSSFLVADLATRFGMERDAADLQRLRSLSQHAETSAPLADAILAIAPAASWPQLSRSVAEALWPSGYWQPPDPHSSLAAQIHQTVQDGQPVVLDIEDERLDQLSGRTGAFFAPPVDAARQRQMTEALESYDVRTVDLRQLAAIALASDWPETDFVEPSPVRYVVLAPDEPPLVIRDNEHETRVRRKLESVARRTKNRNTRN